MKDVLFQCTIPGRTRIKKNGKRILRNPRTGSRLVASSCRFKAWELFATSFVVRAIKGPAIDFPVAVRLVFYFKDHQHEADLSNLLEGPLDLLQNCNVLKNDRLVYSLDGSRKVFGADRERLEITITRFEIAENEGVKTA